MADKDGFNRRDFLKASAAAVAGGVFLMESAAAANASSVTKDGPISSSASDASGGFLTRSTSAFASPRRLSDKTHVLAKLGISGEWGRATVNAEVRLEEHVDVSGLSEEMKYAQSIKLIAEHAPLRVIPFERIVGSATLRESTGHNVPIYSRSSVSHTTIGFGNALKIGYKGLRKQIEDRLARGGLDAKGIDLLNAMLVCLAAADHWHARYMSHLTELVAASKGDERANYEQVLANLRNVPENPPKTFAEAVQSLWFMYAFQRLCGNWSGIGRIDDMLGPCLKSDLASGTITIDEAREMIAHFWIKGTEWTGASPFGGSGDAQFYQNIVLGGVDADGKELTNEVTYLVLDVVEELHVSDFPIAVRLNHDSPKKLLRKMAEVQRHGGGIVAMYNEDVVIPALVKFGYPLAEARSFANDGCWEALIPGKTNFIYTPFDTLRLLQIALGFEDPAKAVPDYADFDALYAGFEKQLRQHLEAHWVGGDYHSKNAAPATMISMMVEGCIENARGYYDRGPKYTVLAPHAGGIANTANSLLAIKKLAYEDKLVTLKEFVDILHDDWKGQEPMRRLVSTRVATYGNDDDEADTMTKRVYDSYVGMASEVHERGGVLMPAGISTFGREIEWRAQRRATADGHHIGEILATNFSPSPGTDKTGPTAALKSYCKMDYTKLPNIGTLELKVLPESVKGEAGVDALVALMRSFVRLGGCFLHIDVVDSAVLLDAQRHPEKYPNLSVRIAGWSARFATLNKDWQDMVIGRTQQRVG